MRYLKKYYIIIIFLISKMLIAQDQDTSNGPVIVKTKSSFEKPISKLPKNIPIYQNKAYIFADFRNAKNVIDQFNHHEKLRFNIYFINNSKDTIVINADHLERTRKEFLNKQNEWMPTKPCNDCDISCVVAFFILAPGEYIIRGDSFNKKGQWKKIRYSLVGYPFEHSNEGFDRIDANESAEALYDELTFKTCDINYFIRIITGDITLKVSAIKANEIKSKAITVMIRRFKENAIPILQLISNTDNHTLQKKATEAIKYFQEEKLK